MKKKNVFFYHLIFRSKYALIAIKKKLYNANPHIAMFGLQVRHQERDLLLLGICYNIIFVGKMLIVNINMDNSYICRIAP